MFGGHGQGNNMFGGMIKNFMNMAGMKKEDVEGMAKQHGVDMPEGAFEGAMKGDFSSFKNMDWSKMKGKCGGMKGKGGGPMSYIKGRAHFVSGTEPQCVFPMTPGSTQFVDVEIKNCTHWPWKQGCWLGMADPVEGEQEATFMPIELVYVPITFDVPAQHSFKLQVPIKALENAHADGKIHKIALRMRRPGDGDTFGETLTIMVKIQPANNEIDEMKLYELALKLHSELKLGTFDDCVAAARANNCDEQATIASFQGRT